MREKKNALTSDMEIQDMKRVGPLFTHYTHLSPFGNGIIFSLPFIVGSV